MSIDIAYRAALLDHQNIRRKAEKMGPHFVEVQAQKMRKQKGSNWFVRTMGDTSAALRAMMATMTRIRRLAES